MRPRHLNTRTTRNMVKAMRKLAQRPFSVRASDVNAMHDWLNMAGRAIRNALYGSCDITSQDDVKRIADQKRYARSLLNNVRDLRQTMKA